MNMKFLLIGVMLFLGGVANANDDIRRAAAKVMPPLLYSSNVTWGNGDTLHVEFEVLTYSPQEDLDYLISLRDSSFSEVKKFSIDFDSPDISNNGNGGYNTFGVSQRRFEISTDVVLTELEKSRLTPTMYYRVYTKNTDILSEVGTVDGNDFNDFYYTLYIPKIITSNLGSLNSPYGGTNQNSMQRYTKVSKLKFPSTGTDWSYTAGSDFHGNVNYASNTFDDTHAYDLNKSGNADSGLAVTPIIDGRTIITNDTYGFVLIEHNIPLVLDDGTRLEKWYSGYMHMNNHFSTNNTDVTINTTIGNISGTGADNDHLHFAIYTLNNGTYTSIDIANQLSDFVEPIDTWYEWCSNTTSPTQTFTSEWWDLGGEPCN